MKRTAKGFRSLDIAHAFLEKKDVIDVLAGFNNVNTKMPVTINQMTILYPPEYPFIGLRGPLGEIVTRLNESLENFTTVELATILGAEPLAITPGEFETTSILKQPQKYNGKDTLIGIIDTGIDYTNPAFIDTKGETRIASIWDQTIGDQSIFGYGTIYDKEMINRALKNSDPFSVVPHKDEWGEGTMLAAIAAGSGKYKEGEYTGVARGAELVVVKIKPASPALQRIYHTKHNPLGFSALDVALAVQYISNLAASHKKPVSICFPIGGNNGPHDGSDTLSDILSTYAMNRGMCIVLAGGDEANKGHHASGDLREIEFQQVRLRIPKGQEGFLVEVWASFGDTIEVSLVPPQAKFSPLSPDSPLTNILLNEPQTHSLNNGNTVWTEGSKLDPQTGCQLIRFRFNDPTEGEWTLSIRGITIINGFYHIWLPKTGMLLPETVLLPASPFVTIYNGSASEGVITVGCYDKTASSPCTGSGRGPTRDNRIKPDFMVEGTNIPAPLPNDKFGYITGTAPSSAITAGICALLYERQKEHDVQLFNTPMMKAMLVEQLIRDETVSYPSSSRGYGLLDINTILY